MNNLKIVVPQGAGLLLEGEYAYIQYPDKSRFKLGKLQSTKPIIVEGVALYFAWEDFAEESETVIHETG